MKKPKFKPGQMVEATDTCAIVTADNVSYNFAMGQKVRASHPAVQSAPALFKELDPEYLPEIERNTSA